MSRQDLSSLCGNHCCDIEKSVATLFICVQLISVRDIETSLQLEACRNIEFFCCNQVSLLSKLHMSRHSLPYHDRGLSLKLFFCPKKLFHVTIISVMT